MGVCAFEQNAIVKIHGEEQRLVRKVTPALWQMENVRTGALERIEHTRLLGMYDEKVLVFPSRGKVAHCGPANSGLSAEDHKAAVLRVAYVREALKAPRTRAGLKQSITELWNRVKEPASAPGYVSVHRWIRRYLDGNSDYRVLVDHNRAKGNRRRPPPPELVEICYQSLESVYLIRERTPLKKALDDAAMRVKEANQTRLKALKLEPPTLRLLQRLLNRIPEYDQYAARYGTEAARKAFRSSKGKIFVESPLDRAEIDHTQLDICLVDSETGQPIGRPWVTACIDVASRCVLGLYVGFSNPSYQTVHICLKDCVRPKAWLKKEYPEVRSEWPAHGVMRDLVIDGGLEFHGTSLEKACNSLGVNIIASPRRTPWAKPHIERFLATLNRAVTEGVPGTTFRSVAEKGDYVSEKHACMTLETLKKNIMQWIADVYHQRPHTALNKSPNQEWVSGISPDQIRYPDDSTHLDAVLGSAHLCRLTHEGVVFKGLAYNSKELEALQRLAGLKLKVEVRVNESDLGSVYVLWPDNPNPIEVPAQDIEYARGLSLHVHEVNRTRVRHNPGLYEGGDELMQASKDISGRVAQEKALQRKRLSKGAQRKTSSKGVQRYLDGSPMAREYRKSTERESSQLHNAESVLVEPYFEDIQSVDGTDTHDEDLGDDLLDFTTTYKGDI
jgi:putative transposase